ncbi:hypothetical protein I302_106534 [Kwoniella bestiolae CBS 10118]|uniref:Uncharacterized protein n=1 Tax=Kwoniella bestiolae CBS 10118 TaxID=1296100 RepID=A0A1B9G156_9TREE|nr:hypothetical protein I302_06207 [Kwoniella bestiolae CBS 10118]OCF24746.1 hypothetical protein I302_06207 [Kwoniella bestiolae CBS 10118]
MSTQGNITHDSLQTNTTGVRPKGGDFSWYHYDEIAKAWVMHTPIVELTGTTPPEDEIRTKDMMITITAKGRIVTITPTKGGTAKDTTMKMAMNIQEGTILPTGTTGAIRLHIPANVNTNLLQVGAE